ncbi:MAG: hypothetical protein JSR39_04630 [Verrucomicrobia bacterium]|nr:hypothetical protein [Verrucomicrobiota bacterium]
MHAYTEKQVKHPWRLTGLSRRRLNRESNLKRAPVLPGADNATLARLDLIALGHAKAS